MSIKKYNKDKNVGVKSLMINMLLVVTAILLFIIVLPFGVLSKIISAVYNIATGNIDRFVGKSANMALSVAVSINQFGNTLYMEFFNAVFIRDTSIYSYGDPNDTVSYVTGINKINHNLTFVGEILDKILDFFDENHTIMTVVKVDGESAIPNEFKKYIIRK